jgi:hypothetical protein
LSPKDDNGGLGIEWLVYCYYRDIKDFAKENLANVASNIITKLK